MKILSIAVKPLLDVMSSQRRFGPEFEFADHDGIIAALSHPRFKLAWLGQDGQKMRVARELFEQEVVKVMEAEAQAQVVESGHETRRNHNSIADNCSSDYDFLIMQDEYNDANIVTSVLLRATTEAAAYFNNPRRDLEMLALYPTIRSVFKRTNTPTCSSAPLERTFNYAGILDNPKRGRIVPETFTNSVIIKGNQAFRKGEEPPKPKGKGSKK